MLAALLLHVTALPARVGGWQAMTTLVEKRLYSRDPEATARAACRDDFFADPNCVPMYLESLRVAPVRVVAKYLAFDDLLPWLPRLKNRGADDAREPLREALRTTLHERSAWPVLEAVRTAGWSGLSRPVLRLVDVAVFALLLALLLRKLFRLRQTDPALIGMMVCAVAAPLSWFVLAKGHSYIHGALNYVLWYLPFVPLALAVLGMPEPPRSEGCNRPWSGWTNRGTRAAAR